MHARSVFVAVEDRRVHEVDARDPGAPRRVRSFPTEQAPTALAVNGSDLYVLGSEGLQVLRMKGEHHVSRFFPSVNGTAMQLTGRTLRLTSPDGGLTTFLDRSKQPRLHVVNVNDNFFSPVNLTIAVGDSVRWTNSSGFHNVASCFPSQLGCPAEDSNESFTSGSPDFGPWLYEYTFTQPGENPYICQSHAPFMTGNVTALGDAPPPPLVPNGSNGAPMRVDKLDPTGSSLAISWDHSSCGQAVDYHIVYGIGRPGPGDLGSGYSITGSRCAMGAESPHVWADSPFSTDPTGLLWWVVIGNNGNVTEGPWGPDSRGLERSGAGVGGASEECGMIKKNADSVCD